MTGTSKDLGSTDLGGTGSTTPEGGLGASGTPAPGNLGGKTILMSGGSRGIGLAIAERAARDGANVVLIAKTDNPDPRLEGTIHTAAAAIEAAGGKVLAVVGDVRDDDTIASAVAQAVSTFGGIDIVVNNASVISLDGTLKVSQKRYDLMQDVNVRGTFMLSKAALPHLLEAENPHILTLSPPLNFDPKWMGANPAYTLAKYGMTLTALGFAAEFAKQGVASNALWPRTTIATAAVANILGGDEMIRRSRTPAIMADAAHAILTSPSRELTGQAIIDEELLRTRGMEDFSGYAVDPTAELMIDLYVDK
ncbi:citronellol/citronellal dehydrogenase [Arthrobacter stackebrandtii]|uniref:Citronellol/citronellal dehydrogenase n=1 Tax=Arthrobacter stackebrandtii TaxID=272161 RepID=A0ABS4YXW5_9MICC|nr:NAD(P)-dependent oxidoreductase [Arthrobacter stackebrandtii]MBP2413647.1 citronellol/citronellal dehydrogenase [Arthrobacter stackebrandtii]PYG99952.1 short chain dehydrogenase [Arthrobacter stackebrandtii]